MERKIRIYRRTKCCMHRIVHIVRVAKLEDEKKNTQMNGPTKRTNEKIIHTIGMRWCLWWRRRRRRRKKMFSIRFRNSSSGRSNRTVLFHTHEIFGFRLQRHSTSHIICMLNAFNSFQWIFFFGCFFGILRSPHWITVFFFTLLWIYTHSNGGMIKWTNEWKKLYSRRILLCSRSRSSSNKKM